MARITRRRSTAGTAIALVAVVLAVTARATTSLAAQAPNWVLKSPVNGPGPRMFAAMAYDAARQEVVLFGGTDNTLNCCNDTWVWDGANWTQRTPAHRPSPRYYPPALAYDVARSQVVLFGGKDSNGGYYNDTWTWDGADWTQQNPATAPPARDLHAMAYDAVRQEVVLFGGTFCCGDLRDTWVWNGSDWSPRSTSTSPPFGTRAMAFDAVRGGVVLFASDGTTWIWTGSDWSQRLTNSPGPSFYTAMAFDWARGQIVLFGGQGNALRDDTWVWDGTDWTEVIPSTTPLARAAHAMAYDEARGQVVMFGGVTNVGFVNDTWVWPGDSAPSTGAISVTTNLAAATFNITGPINYSGGGTSFAVDDAPAGTYTITYGSVAGYVTPLPETKPLAAGSVISYVGTYALVEPGQVLLTVRKSGSGSGSVRSKAGGIDCGMTCAAAVKLGSRVKLEAVADPGSTFVGWSDSFCKGTLRPCSFTIPANRTITATFIQTSQDSGNKMIYVGVCGAGYLFDDTCFSGSGWYDPRDVFSWVDPLDDDQLDAEATSGQFSGLDAIGLRIGRLFPTSVTLVTGFSAADVVSDTVLPKLIKNNAAQIIDFIVGEYNPGDRIYLVGHSAGGGVVQEAAKGLLKRQIPIAMTAQIDSVGLDAKVPTNVARAFNFYYPVNGLCLVAGETQLVGAKRKSDTVVSNFPIDAPLGPKALNSWCGGHVNMDNDPLVWRPILDFMVGIP